MASEQVNEFKTKGNQAFGAEKFEEAVEWFTKAIELDPHNHILFSNRSGAYVKLNQLQKALDDANKTIEIKSDWGKGYSRKGTALCYMRDYSEAVQVFHQGLKIDPNNQALKDGLKDAEMGLQQQQQQQQNPLAKIFSAPDLWPKIAAHPKLSAYLGQPDFVQKIKMIQAHPQSVQSHLSDPRVMEVMAMLIGLDLSRPEDMQGAGPDMNDIPTGFEEEEKKEETKAKASASSPMDQKPQPQQQPMETEEVNEEERQAKKYKEDAVKEKDRGNELYKQRKFDGALECYKRARELDPQNITILNNIAAVYFESDQLDKCIETCQTAVNDGRNQMADFKIIARALARMASAYVKQNKFDEAIATYKESLTESRDPEVLKKLNQTERAKKEYEDRMYQDPEKATEAKEKGNEFFRQDKFPEAVQQYTEAIKRNPSDGKVFSNRAAAYMKLGAYPDALKDCEKCLSLEPTFVKAWTRKAHCHFFLKEYHKALEAYDEGLKLDPSNQELIDGSKRVIATINRSQSDQGVDQERVRKAMADPEIQSIMSDPGMQLMLKDMTENPQAAQEYLRDPEFSRKLQKLVAAGIVQLK